MTQTPEEKRAKDKVYRDTHQDQIKAAGKSCREVHRDEYNAKGLAYYYAYKRDKQLLPEREKHEEDAALFKNGLRKCIKCGEIKPLSEFTKGGSAYRNFHGIMTQCKTCWKKYWNSWVSQNRDKNAKYHHDTKQKRMKDHFFQWRSSNWNHRNKAKTTAEELASLWKKQRGRCALSGRKLGRDAQLDHIIPRSKGGTSVINNLRWLDPMANIMRKNVSDKELIQFCEDLVKWTCINRIEVLK
jgi:hypothetical protein